VITNQVGSSTLEILHRLSESFLPVVSYLSLKDFTWTNSAVQFSFFCSETENGNLNAWATRDPSGFPHRPSLTVSGSHSDLLKKCSVIFLLFRIACQLLITTIIFYSFPWLFHDFLQSSPIKYRWIMQNVRLCTGLRLCQTRWPSESHCGTTMVVSQNLWSLTFNILICLLMCNGWRIVIACYNFNFALAFISELDSIN